MKRIAIVLLVLVCGACATRAGRVSPAPIENPDSVLRLPSYVLGHAEAESSMMRVGAPAPVVFPVGTAARVAFCPTDELWLARAPADRWYQVNVDGQRLPWLGPLLADSASGPTCVVTTEPTTFATPGVHSVTVQLVIPDYLVTPDIDSCVVGQHCYSIPSEEAVAQISGAVMAGPPPAVQKAQIIR